MSLKEVFSAVSPCIHCDLPTLLAPIEVMNSTLGIYRDDISRLTVEEANQLMVALQSREPDEDIEY